MVKQWVLGQSVDQADWLIDRKSTRLNSSHGYISYAVFCLKKKKNEDLFVDHLHVECAHLFGYLSSDLSACVSAFHVNLSLPRVCLKRFTSSLARVRIRVL